MNNPNLITQNSDIVHFTEYASKATVEEVVTMLNAQYSRFDNIANHLKIEKIKTIGDAYFAIEGLRGNNSVVNMVEMGNRMLEAVKSLNEKNGWDIQMRIGIHTGSAVSIFFIKKKILKFVACSCNWRR